MWTTRVIQNSIKLNIQQGRMMYEKLSTVEPKHIKTLAFSSWTCMASGFEVLNTSEHWKTIRKKSVKKEPNSYQFVPSTSVHNNLLRILNRLVSFCLLRLLMFRRFTDLEFHLGVRNTYKLWRPVKDAHFHTASYSHCASRLSLTTLMIFLAFPKTHDGSLD